MNTTMKPAQNLPRHGWFLHQHVETGIQFMVEGAGLQYYFKHLKSLDHGTWFRVMGDISIQTSYDFTVYRIWAANKEDLTTLLHLLQDKEKCQLSRPQLVINEAFLEMAYRGECKA